ncbi:MAG: nucleoside kinase [Clostridiales bacterium]|jgi:uridine kinase|nr:nucleoside kinase [Clostridiales bacterium]
MIRSGNSYHKFSHQLEQINALALQTPQEFVSQMESAYQDSIQELAAQLLEPENHCKVVMLAGPSGSGKTTTAHLLRDQLKKMGAGTTILSLDDFYQGRDMAPRLPNGEFDYEAVEALDIPQIHSCLLGLLEHGFCEKPNFDFVEGRPTEHRTKVVLSEHDIAIVEGIHALNPVMTKNMSTKGLRKIYLSVKQGIACEQGELLTPSDIRFIRRLVRDYKYRGVQPHEMIAMWENVCRGENLYIKPYRHTSNYTINSIHIYEACVMRDIAIPLLQEISKEDPQYLFAKRLISCLERFTPISSNLVPKGSLLREFIGGGLY